MQTFFAHGKLLLAGEYIVLKGGVALAIPTSYGQSLSLNVNDQPTLQWKSIDHQGGVWFEASFDLHLNLITSSSDDKGEYLKTLLTTGFDMSKKEPEAQTLVSTLDFPNDWGLGSSSTLVHLIAQWLEVNPIELFFRTSTGSGYDVACAGEKLPLLYHLDDQKAHWEIVELPKVFEQVYFIHLNQKQRSKPEVQRFLKSETSKKEINDISKISQQMLEVNSTKELQLLMEEHESLMSEQLSHSPVKKRLFEDYNGSIKSLGAWGGDFIMALGENTPAYFRSKSYNTIIPFKDIIA